MSCLGGIFALKKNTRREKIIFSEPIGLVNLISKRDVFHKYLKMIYVFNYTEYHSQQQLLCK
jgi:hypothetical protein